MENRSWLGNRGWNWMILSAGNMGFVMTTVCNGSFEGYAILAVS